MQTKVDKPALDTSPPVLKADEPCQRELLKVGKPLEWVDNQQFYHPAASNSRDETVSTARNVSRFYTSWTKTIDCIFGLCGTGTLLLILPILGPLIYLDSPGPLFYTQERLGYLKRTFRVYKFRSMRPEAGRTGHMTWATAHDPRVTRIGRFLRATHLDELPQVLNILRGEMSLIGPRPELPVFSEQLEKVIPFYNHRFTVKPGLTGWTQVNHNYGDTIDDERIKLQHDLYYIQNRSCFLDIEIIARTVGEVVLGHGR